jgi:D-tyrosyl-tRNA(Tyr) deacylase
MRLVIQRVTEASVKVDNKIVGNIRKGLLVLVGIADEDDEDDLYWCANKLCQMRIFSDDDNKMNLSIKDVNGSLLLISQFTLFASTKKGNRPGFTKAARPDKAIHMYELFQSFIKSEYDINIENGIFGADMQVKLTNDGPVTIIIDSKNKE